METKKQTGYPSIDKPWLKYYESKAFERAHDIPQGKTLWDVMEEKLKEYPDIPALKYFGRKISRPEFIRMVYEWARAFKALGVAQDEVVPVYGPFVPDVCAMAFALNVVGATAYFLKLAISPEALAEETEEARIAVVFDAMWGNVSTEFSKDKFEKVIIYSVTDSMPFPIKVLVKTKDMLATKTKLPKGTKYLSTAAAKKLAKQYNGEIKATFVPNRNIFITSSSGTSGNVVKGTIATNETVLAQLWQSKNAGINYHAGETCLTNFPPTASTSLNCLFLLPLFMGMTLINDPRVSEDLFYIEIMRYKPHVVIATGSLWEAFYRRIEIEIAKGNKVDLSYSQMWILGGEGTNPVYLSKWNEIMKACGSEFPLYSGYGQSELFAVATVNKKGCFDKSIPNGRPVINVGLPYPGIDVGIFDENGNELAFNQRGELWIKSDSIMKGYYRKSELTEAVIRDDWLHTGDIVDMDENGFLYIWGRMSDKIEVDGAPLYLFDIAYKIMENSAVADTVVLQMPSEDDTVSLAAHIAWETNISEEQKAGVLQEIQNRMRDYLPRNIVITGYADHGIMLPYSPTTLKKDKNKMARQLTGYKIVKNGSWHNVEFSLKTNEN